MLAANEAVAARCRPCIRSWPGAPPEPFKLDEFAESSAAWASTSRTPEPVRAPARLAEPAGTGRYAVHYGLLRSLKQATYTPEPRAITRWPARTIATSPRRSPLS